MTTMLEDFIAAFEYLKVHPECSGKVGVVGFCFGGWISNMMAVKVPGLGASVPFYGGQPTEDIDKINAPLLLHFGELDTRVNEGWPAYEEALQRQTTVFTMTPPRGMIGKPLNWPGDGPSIFLGKNSLKIEL